MGIGLLLALAAWSAPAAAQDVDLGIPAEAPWAGAEGKKRKEGTEKEARPTHELEERFWDRLEEDIASMEGGRTGMREVLRYARTQDRIFPARPKEEAAPLFEEYAETAEGLWIRAMDYWLAVESLRRRYSRFHELSETGKRRAAFLLAYACYLAQARFASDWSELAGRDPSLVAIFEKPAPSLGLDAGSFTALENRVKGTGFSRELLALRSYYRAIGGAGALKPVLGAGVSSWARLRESDLRGLRAPKRFRLLSAETAVEALKTGPASRDFAVVSLARAWTDAYEAPASTRIPVLPPQPDWSRATASTRAAYAVDAVRHWFGLEGPEGNRPEVLITSQQALSFAESLAPGDILLVRRERFVGEAGLGGYWHGAGVYVGSPEARREFFKDEPALVQKLAEEYKRVSGRDGAPKPKNDRLAGLRSGVVRSIEDFKFWKKKAPVEDGAKPVEEEKAPPPPEPEALAVIRADVRGVALEELSRFAAADAFAALRPRLDRRSLGEALLRAFEHAGRPYDFEYDFKTGGALSSAELVYRAFRPAGRSGIRLPLVETAGRWSMSANALARKYDADFGTDRQDLDMVIFVDVRESRHASEASTLEEFRRSWRRPKWTFKGENHEE